MPTPLQAVLTRNGKPQERAHDATGLPTDPASSPAHILNVDDAVHRFRAPSRNQLPRSQRKHHHIHPRPIPSNRTLLGHGRLRTQNTLREPPLQTRLLKPAHATAISRAPFSVRRTSRSEEHTSELQSR